MENKKRFCPGADVTVTLTFKEAALIASLLRIKSEHALEMRSFYENPLNSCEVPDCSRFIDYFNNALLEYDSLHRKILGVSLPVLLEENENEA